VVNLRYGVDYDVDYLQGRLLLSEPLSSTAADNLLVRSSGLSGDQANLVVRYEYTPGFDTLDAIAVGGQGHYWLNDHVRIGLTGNLNDDGDTDNNLGAADVTLRKSTDSWFKLQTARSEGLLSRSLRSDDGGFGFQGPDDLSFTDAQAVAYRADFSVGLGDFFDGHDGRATRGLARLVTQLAPGPLQRPVHQAVTSSGLARRLAPRCHGQREHEHPHAEPLDGRSSGGNRGRTGQHRPLTTSGSANRRGADVTPRGRSLSSAR